MMFRVAFILACLFVFPLPALADRADADACAVKLAGLSLETYKASIDKAAGGATLRQAIGGYLKPLYDAGKITERQGYKSGYAAAMCVRLVHRKTRQRSRPADPEITTASIPNTAKPVAKPRDKGILDDEDDD